MINLKKGIEVAKKAILKSGKLLLADFNKTTIVKWNKGFDFTTKTDLKSQEIIVNEIRKNFPNHGIVAEENYCRNPKAIYQWYIDPLDGTKEFFRGIPNFNIAISLQKKDHLILGMVYRPTTKELFYAWENGGAWKNEVKIKVSQQSKLMESYLYTHLPEKDFNWQALEKINNKVYKIRGFQEENASLAWLAMGACEAVIHLNKPCRCKWWDVAAGFIIVREAGGYVSDLNGQEIKPTLKNGFIASNKTIHHQIIKILS